MRARFTPPDDIELAGTRSEFDEVVQRIEQLGTSPATEVAFDLVTTGSPAPYKNWLRRFVIAKTGTLPKVAVRDDVLSIVGDSAGLSRIAGNLRFLRGNPAAKHIHFEYFPGNQHISPDSLPLVIAVDEGSPRAS